LKFLPRDVSSVPRHSVNAGTSHTITPFFPNLSRFQEPFFFHSSFQAVTCKRVFFSRDGWIPPVVGPGCISLHPRPLVSFLSEAFFLWTMCLDTSVTPLRSLFPVGILSLFSLPIGLHFFVPFSSLLNLPRFRVRFSLSSDGFLSLSRSSTDLVLHRIIDPPPLWPPPCIFLILFPPCRAFLR